MNHFSPPPSELYFSKNDPQDPRLGEIFKSSTGANTTDRTEAPLVTLLGYPDDDGIQRNGGRIGAARGPDEIRKWLFRMTSPQNLDATLLDLGNLSNFKDLSLQERHDLCSEKLKAPLKAGGLGLTFGGGHDYGYPDGKAFLESIHQRDIKPLIINFDAHLDVRDLKFGITSGTPFFRLRQEFKNFDMVQVGIQNQCNSKAHLEWCKANNIDVLSLDEFYGKPDPLLEVFERTWTHHVSPKRPAYVSIDIDGFSSAYAPGCSQSWPTGMEPRDFFPLFDWILDQLDVRLLSIYEVSPPLDVQSVTAKLAAQIAYRYLEVTCSKA